MQKPAIGSSMPPAQKGNLHKILLVMRLTVFLLTVSMMGVHAKGVSQSVTYTAQNADVKKVFSVIKEQTGYVVFYNQDILEDAKPVSVDARNMPLDDFLDLISRDQPFSYLITDKTISLSRKSTLLPMVNEIKQQELAPPLKGRVVNDKGEAVVGATVKVKGTNNVTTTNSNGEFVLNDVDGKATIIVTATNIEEQQIRVNARENIIVVATIKISDLDQVQVIAYGKQSQRFSTGSVSTITSKDIERKPVANVLLAIQAEVPGIIIQQASGFANAGINVQIRGINSLLQGIDPLYVIDGVPYTSQLMESVLGVSLGYSGDQTRAFVKQGNPLSFINPADIESISILKDADATSIYGSRAASGAILITTKKGKSGPNRLNINIQQGWGKGTRFVDLLNRDEYMEMRHEAKANSNQPILPSDYDLNGVWDTARTTDWQKTLLGGTAKYSDFQISTTGGTENTKFLVGAGYHMENSVFLSDVINRKASIHFNITSSSPNQKFNLQLSGSYMLDNNMVPVALNIAARNLPPVAPALFNPDGSLNWQPNASGTSTFSNPLAFAASKAVNKTNNLVSNLQLSYEIIGGLKFKTSMGFNNMQINELFTAPTAVVAPERRASYVRNGRYSNGTIRSWIVEPIITYEKKGKKGKFEALLGSTLQYNNNYQQVFQGTGFISDQLIEDPSAAANIQYLSTTATTYRYNALFARVNYRFMERYILNMSARRDGSSRFGPENLFHNFASVGTAWIFSSERFISRHLPFLSFGKLQFSYGNTGNDQIGDYTYLNRYISANQQNNYQGVTGLAVNGLSNPYLQWEETKKMQFSIDLGAINNRLLFNATYFRNRSSNQLLGYSLPSQTGFTGYTRNFPATLQNSGWELSLNADIIKTEHIRWTSRLNIYVPQNKLIAFQDLSSSSYASTYRIGHPISEVKVFMYAGVNPETGVYQFKDSKGNIVANPQYPADTRLINTAPSYTGGFSNTFTFHAFQLDFLIQCSKQWASNNKAGYGFAGSRSNQPTSVLDRWRTIGDDNMSIQKFVTVNSEVVDGYYNVISSDFTYTNAYLVRLKNLSLSWSVPAAWCRRAKLQNGQIFVHAQNLLTITNFESGDPETGISGSLPPLRIITAGVQLSL